MPDRSPSLRRLCSLAAAVIAATGGGASVGRTQQVAGSIGASLTILASIGAPPRITGFHVGRDGAVRIEATLPDSPGVRSEEGGSARAAPLVMVRVSRAGGPFTPDAQPYLSLAPSQGEQHLLHVMKLNRLPRAIDIRSTELRVEYLIVAGT
jgi:hypothetical protein